MAKSNELRDKREPASLSALRSLLDFLFPPETDTWLSVLRIGLGLQVCVYALFLRSDWHYMFASKGKGLVGREIGEAITSFDSPLIPKLSWLIALGRSVNMSEEAALSIAWACLLSAGCFCCWDSSAAQRRLLPGFSTFAPLKAEDYSPTGPITL